MNLLNDWINLEVEKRVYGESKKKFYTTVFLGIALTVFGLATVSTERYMKERTLAEHGYEIQAHDLNKNGAPEVYYTIKGVKYFSVIDGEILQNRF